MVQNYPGTDYALKAQKNLALLYILVGKDAQAQAAVDKLAADFSSNSNLPAALNDIASEYRWTKKYQQIKSVYQKIIQNCPGSQQAGNAPLELAKMDILALIDAQADSQVQAAIDNLITDFYGHSYLSEVLYDIAQVYGWSDKEYEKIKGVYQQVLQSCPGSSFADKAEVYIQTAEVLSAAIDAGDISRAQAEMNKLKTSFSGSPYLPEALYQIANRYEWRAKDYTQAKSIYQDIASQYSGTWCADNAQLDVPKTDILIHIEAGEDSLAQSEIDRLISNFSGNSYLAEVLFYIAERFEDAGKYQKAKQTFQKVVQNCPDTVFAIKARFGLAKEDIMSLINSGQNNAAYAAIDEFIADNPDNFQLTWILSEIAEHYYERAIDLERQGVTGQAAGYLVMAKGVWQTIIEDTPAYPYTIPYALSMVGNCYRRLGDYQKSIEYYQQIVDSYPEHFSAWDGLLIIGRNWRDLARSGAISQSQANSQITAAYQQLVSTYPDCPAAKVAVRWLSNHN